MTITYRLADAGLGSGLVGLHESLPPGLATNDNEVGWRMCIEKLATLVENATQSLTRPIRGRVLEVMPARAPVRHGTAEVTAAPMRPGPQGGDSGPPTGRSGTTGTLRFGLPGRRASPELVPLSGGVPSSPGCLT